MNETTVVWVVLLAGPSLFGGVCALRFRRRIAYLLSGLVPWCIFLIFNLYEEMYGLEKELMRGTWWLFQITIGTFVAAIGLLGCWLANRAKQ